MACRRPSPRGPSRGHDPRRGASAPVLRARVGRQARLEALLDLPLPADLAFVLPVAGGPAGRPRPAPWSRSRAGAPRSCPAGRPASASAGRCARRRRPRAVRPGDAGILLHGVEHVHALQGDRLQRGARDLRASGAARHADQGATRERVPVRSPRPAKAGTSDAAGVFALACQRFHFRCARMICRPSRSRWMVAPPMKTRLPGSRRCARRSASPPWSAGGCATSPAGCRYSSAGNTRCHRCSWPCRATGRRPKVAACWSPAMPAIGTRRQTAGMPSARPRRSKVRPRAARCADVEQGEQLVVPGEAMDIEQHGAGRIRHVGDVARAVGELPDERRRRCRRRVRRARRVRAHPRCGRASSATVPEK